MPTNGGNTSGTSGLHRSTAWAWRNRRHFSRGDFACCTSPTRPACCGTSLIGEPRAINEDYLSCVRHRGRNHSVPMIVTRTDAEKFAADWAEDWNRRDVEAVLAHF